MYAIRSYYAEIIAIQMSLQAVYIMAVAAPYAVLIHFGLDKGAIDIHFLKNLAIRIIETILDQGRHHGIESYNFV